MYKTLSDLPKPFIIADIGSNWCRYPTKEENLTCALRQITSAASIGVNAVKFQMFTEEELYGFKRENNKYELPREWIPELASRAASCGVEFMCTAFSTDGYRYVDQFVNVHKIASAEITDLELVDSVLKLHKPTLISTAAANNTDLETVLSLTIDDSQKHFGFMECVGSYPARLEDYCLSWRVPGLIGLSDHTTSQELSLVAAGKGLTIFETHYDCLASTTDGERLPPTPDSHFARNAHQLFEYCKKIKAAYGVATEHKDGHRDCESKFITQHRRRLIATKDLEPGEVIAYGCHRLKAPHFVSGRALQPVDVSGKKAKRQISVGEPLMHSDIA